LKGNRLLLIILVILLLLVTACSVPSARDLPVISQWLAPSPTPSPLSTATPTRLHGATVDPLSTQTPILGPTGTGTPFVNPEPTSTGTLSATIMDTPTPTPTLAPAPPPHVGALEIARGDASRPWIALTFDAGASIDPWPSILETLRQKDVRCTFFLTGDTLRRPEAPDLLRQTVADGHELGNHSDTHPDFTELTDEQMGVELAAVENAVMEITGRSTKPYFRPPFGSRDDRVWRVVQENGYVTIYWTYHVWDWTEDRTAEKVYSSAIEGACNGAIVVMHVGAWETADTLPDIIDELRARGYRLVTLSELLSP
jgi:peptidoglycan/xylan/chitin deacetylase (PgdA/CDA1 family)